MAINADLPDLQAIYDHLDKESEAPQERREHPRTFAKGHIPATLEIAGGLPIAASVRDLSRSGVGVFAMNPVKLGTQVTVSFRLGAGPVRAVCRVVNCREDDGGRYVVGMAMVEVRRSQLPVPGAAEPSPKAEAGGLPGEMVSASQAMAGADPSVVSGVVQRIARLLVQS